MYIEIFKVKTSPIGPQSAAATISTELNPQRRSRSRDRGTLHLELSSKCVLKCPLCPRTLYNESSRPFDMPLELVEVALKDHWNDILLCGNHGDPIYHAQFHWVLEYIKKLPYKPTVYIESNGSYKTRSWWQQTASLLDENDTFCFSIDGLADTNHVYRINSDWNSIMTGLSALKEHSSCQLVWKFILFKHNENQVMEAYKISKQFGMKFKFVKSSRCRDGDFARLSASFDSICRSLNDLT